MLPAVNKENFQSLVLDSKVPVFVVFTAPWDVHASPTVSFLKSLLPGTLSYSVDFDVERELVTKYSIRQLPFVMVFKDGELIHTVRAIENADVLEALLSYKL